MELLPFDLDEYREDPSRLRHKATEDRAAWSRELPDGYLAAKFDCDRNPRFFEPDEHCYLALAPKVRKVKVRLYRCRNTGLAYAATSDQWLGGELTGYGYNWIGEAFEREIPA